METDFFLSLLEGITIADDGELSFDYGKRGGLPAPLNKARLGFKPYGSSRWQFMGGKMFAAYKKPSDRKVKGTSSILRALKSTDNEGVANLVNRSAHLIKRGLRLDGISPDIIAVMPSSKPLAKKFADRLGELLGIPVDATLIQKAEADMSITGVAVADRTRQKAKMFKQPKAKLEGKSILIVDDFATSSESMMQSFEALSDTYPDDINGAVIFSS